MSETLNNDALEWLADREKKLFVEAHAEAHVLQNILTSCPSFKQFYEARRNEISNQVVWWRPYEKIRERAKPAAGYAVAKQFKFPRGRVWTITLERIPAILADTPQIATELAVIIISQNGMPSISDLQDERILRHGWVIEQAVLEILAANLIAEYGIKRKIISRNPFGHSIANYALWPEGLRSLLVFECFRQIMLNKIASGFGSVGEAPRTKNSSAISSDIEEIRNRYPSVMEEAEVLVELAKQLGFFTRQGQNMFFQEILARYGTKDCSVNLNRNNLETCDRQKSGLILNFRRGEDGILGPEVVFNGILIESCPDPFGLCYPSDQNNWFDSPEEVVSLIKNLLRGKETAITLSKRSDLPGRCDCDSGLAFLGKLGESKKARVLLWQDVYKIKASSPKWPPRCPIVYDTIMFAREPIEMDSLGHRMRDSAEIDVDEILCQIVEAMIKNLERATSLSLLDWDDWFARLAEIYDDPLGCECLKNHGLILSYLKMGDRMIPHCEDGPCVVYRDQFQLWALNGVIVEQGLVETKADDLDPIMILEEPNAQVRREIVRKIGIERVCTGLNATIVDSENDYQLLELDLKDGRRRPYLKMKNPSTGTWHIEGVDPDCSTVREALAWRNWTSELPVRLT